MRHHVDCDKRNNDPRNLRRMTWAGHAALHASIISENREQLDAGFRAWLDNGGLEFKSAMLSEQWTDPAFRTACLERLAVLNADPAFRSRIEQGFQDWFTALSTEEKTAYSSRMRAYQAEYWADPEHRAAAAERARAFFDDPAMRARWSERASEQWQDPGLLAWRSAKTRDQFAAPAERDRQRRAVAAWHEAHPEAGRRHAELMRDRLRKDRALVSRLHAGRDEYLRTVAPAERAAKQREGFRLAAVKRLSRLLHLPDGELAAAYEADRLANARTGIRWDKLVDSYEGDLSRLREAAGLINHSVTGVRVLTETADVYDLTVDGYHNFALEAGVFVHNSARMARSAEFQALLPIRGKILNVQKASLQQVLDNVECSAIVQVLGPVPAVRSICRRCGTAGS